MKATILAAIVLATVTLASAAPTGLFVSGASQFIATFLFPLDFRHPMSAVFQLQTADFREKPKNPAIN